MISISENAAQRIESLKLEEKKPQEYFLRVQIKKGGCSGLSYKMEFDNTIKSDDKIFEQHNTKVVIDPTSFMYIIGMTLDYSGGLNGKGFVFDNPNATKNCGCGSSFNV